MCTKNESIEIIEMWKNFDKAKKTKIAESVQRIISIRFSD
jgi:hypothetical protein